MKISVTFTVELDPADWMLAFDTDRAEIRRDVKDYLFHEMQHCGVFGDDEVPATFTLGHEAHDDDPPQPESVDDLEEFLGQCVVDADMSLDGDEAAALAEALSRHYTITSRKG